MGQASAKVAESWLRTPLVTVCTSIPTSSDVATRLMLLYHKEGVGYFLVTTVGPWPHAELRSRLALVGKECRGEMESLKGIGSTLVSIGASERRSNVYLIGRRRGACVSLAPSH